MHKGLQAFLENRSKNINEHQNENEVRAPESKDNGDDSVQIKEEPVEETSIETQELSENSSSISEPPEKRIRLQLPPGRHTIIGASDEDKLDYLKFLLHQDGNFVCGICGRKKTVRKHMLHHLKQHPEVPTYDCPSCPERFVFKKKYECHLKTHAAQSTQATALRQDEVNAEEHPRFQDATPPEIKCHICEMNLKMNFMLNRHNATWHSNDNPMKNLSMNEQKAKKEAIEHRPEVGIIKLLRCKHCFEAFIQPDDLVSHLKSKHNSDSIDQPPASLEMENEEETDDETSPRDYDSSKKQSYSCKNCRFVFHEKKFLENHQKYFCANRQMKSESIENANQPLPVNEQ
jgi:hypothetical protein